MYKKILTVLLLTGIAFSQQKIGIVFSEKIIEGFWLVKWFRETEIAEQMQVIKAVQERFVSGNWKTEVSEVLKLHEVMTGLPAALKTDAKVMFTPK